MFDVTLSSFPPINKVSSQKTLKYKVLTHFWGNEFQYCIQNLWLINSIIYFWDLRIFHGKFILIKEIHSHSKLGKIPLKTMTKLFSFFPIRTPPHAYLTMCRPLTLTFLTKNGDYFNHRAFIIYAWHKSLHSSPLSKMET